MESNDPYREGHDAAEGHYRGKLSYAQSQCPYPKDSENAEEWNRGHSDFYQMLDAFWSEE